MANVGKILGNIAFLGLKLVQSFVSVSFAIASEGATAPLAALSLISTATSIRDFIEDPSGDINQTLKEGVKGVSDFIGMPNATAHVVNVINRVHNESVPLPYNVDVLPTQNNIARNAITEVNRQNASNGGVLNSSIQALSNPVMRQMRSVNNNSHSRAILNTINNSIDAVAAGVQSQTIQNV
jgi:hypothetical protein